MDRDEAANPVTGAKAADTGISTWPTLQQRMTGGTPQPPHLYEDSREDGCENGDSRRSHPMDTSDWRGGYLCHVGVDWLRERGRATSFDRESCRRRKNSVLLFLGPDRGTFYLSHGQGNSTPLSGTRGWCAFYEDRWAPDISWEWRDGARLTGRNLSPHPNF